MADEKMPAIFEKKSFQQKLRPGTNFCSISMMKPAAANMSIQMRSSTVLSENKFAIKVSEAKDKK